MTGNPTANGNSNLEIAQSNQDLIMTKGKRKKRTWILAGIACIIILALIIAALVILNNEKKVKKHNRLPDAEALTLDDVIYGKLNAKSFNATWISGNELLYSDEARNLVRLNVETQNKTIVLPGTDELLLAAFEFKLSADNNFLLVSYDYQKIYRHSFLAKYTIIDLSSGGRNELSAGTNPYLQLVVWAPVGNALVFVFKNSVFYKKSAREGEPVQLAAGNEFVYNGVPDWVYEEEVLSSNKAVWFSPDGKKLTYGTFNDTKVPLMVLPIYGEPGNLHFQYPRANVIKYPKAGAPNPEVKLTVVDLENTDSRKQLGPPSELNNKDPILTAVQWANNDTVTAIWMNRVQNEAAIVAYKAEGPEGARTVKHLKQSGGWLELFTPPIYSKDGSQLVLILSQDQGNSLGSYRHVTMIPLDDGGREEAITKGAFVVIQILGWDHTDNLIYYLANTPNDSSVAHLYSVQPETKTVQCLSCNIKRDNLTDCTYNNAEFSNDYSNYVLTCNGPDIPQTTIYSKANNKLMVWENNDDLMGMLKTKKLPITKKLTFNVADGFTARVILKLPPNMDTSGNTKYPMLVNVYGGPDSYQVIDRFNLDWGTYLTTNKGIIYALIDGRGSGLRGDKLLFAGYRHLGTVEVADQINVTSMIQDTLPYVDASRTAIWGWSYGGYASGMVLAEDKEGVFKCGISVAPVTDWTLYDSVYTERFMGQPKPDDNLKGYMDSLLLTKYEGLRNKMYFLIHGTYDDNVHYQQSMMWSKMLEQKDILFRQLTYPDEDHGLASVRPHLYHSLENFLDDCFVEKEED